MADEKKQATPNPIEPKYTLKSIGDNKYEIEITIPAKLFSMTYEKILQDQLAKQKMPGFREGNAPKELLEKQIGPAVQQEAFSSLAPVVIDYVIAKEQLHIAPPLEYTNVPKNFILGSDIKFTITVFTFPEIKLPDLKKIKVKKPEVKIDESRIAKVLQETFDHPSNAELKKKHKKPSDEWAKEFAQTFGIPNISSLDDLKQSFRDYLAKESEQQAQNAMVDEAFKQAIDMLDIKLAPETIDYEAQKREDELTKQLEQAGTTLEKYCETNKTTVEKMREGWRKDAEMGYKFSLFIFAYAKEKGITATEDEIKHEIEHLKQHYKDQVDEKMFDTPEWQEEIKTRIIRQKAINEFVKEVFPEFVQEHNHEHDHEHNHNDESKKGTSKGEKSKTKKEQK